MLGVSRIAVKRNDNKTIRMLVRKLTERVLRAAVDHLEQHFASHPRLSSYVLWIDPSREI